jgi:hypothetical protein
MSSQVWDQMVAKYGHKSFEVSHRPFGRLDKRLLNVELDGGRSTLDGDIAFELIHITELGSEHRVWTSLLIDQARDLRDHVDSLIDRLEREAIEAAR